MWDRLDHARASRISVSRPAPNLDDDDETAAAVAWAAARATEFMRLDHLWRQVAEQVISEHTKDPSLSSGE